MIALASKQEPRVGHRHIVLADMHAVGFGSERNINPIVDKQRNALRLKHRAQAARLLDHRARRPVLVAQLHQRGAAGDVCRQIGKRAAAGDGRIDKGIKSEIDVHQVTFARAISVGAIEIVESVDDRDREAAGSCGFFAASSPATPMISSAAAVA